MTEHKAAEANYRAGWHYAMSHPNESAVPEWVRSGEWCAGFADAHYTMQQARNANERLF